VKKHAPASAMVAILVKSVAPGSEGSWRV
jgi:hypothetical protein